MHNTIFTVYFYNLIKNVRLIKISIYLKVKINNSSTDILQIKNYKNIYTYTQLLLHTDHQIISFYP